MKRLMMVMFAMTTLAAAGCGKKSSDPVSQMKGFADRACACKGDEKCLEKLEDDFRAWEKKAHEGKKPDDATMEKLKAEEARLEACAEGGGEDKE